MTGSPLDLFIEKLREVRDTSGKPFYTGIEILHLDTIVWVEVARARTAAGVHQVCLRIW